MHVERDNMPAAYEIKLIPGGKALVCLFENFEHMTSGEGDARRDVYTGDEYDIEVFACAQLEADVAGNTANWLARTKAREGVNEPKTVVERVDKVEISQNELIVIVAAALEVSIE